MKQVLKWCSEHPEIDSLLLTPEKDYFPLGPSPKDLVKMEREELLELFALIYQVTIELLHLPQTTLLDFHKGCTGLGLELSLGADLRLAEAGAEFKFNQLLQGLPPCSGGMAILGLLVGPAVAKNWILSTSKLSAKVFREKGILLDIYKETNRDGTVQKYLKNIYQQAPIPRIQTKKAFLEKLVPEIRRLLIVEEKVTKGGTLSEDWKQLKNSWDNRNSFMGVKEFKQFIEHISDKSMPK